MIIVNLLPEHLRPIKRTPLPYVITIGVSLAAFAVLGLLYAGDMTRRMSLEAEFSATSNELNSLAHITTEYNQLEEQKLALADKVSVIQEILGERKIWSEHLHRLASLTPENIWYKQIRIGSQPFREQVPKIDPRTGRVVINRNTQEPEMETRNVRRPVLIVSGYVIPNEQGLAHFNTLSLNTTEDPEFSRHFVLFRPNMEDTEFDGYFVRSFSLEYLIQQGADV